MPRLLRAEIMRGEVIVIATAPPTIIVIAEEGRLGLPRPKGSPSLSRTAPTGCSVLPGLRPPPSGAVLRPGLVRVSFSQECLSPGLLPW